MSIEYDYQIKKLNEEFNRIPPAFSSVDKNTKIILDDCEFNLNSLGLRGEEFDKKNEILYSGCSVTLGIGLDQNSIWGEILSQKLNFSKSNLSFAGASVVHIVNQIFNYIKIYGNPKIILCAFPSFGRIRWWDDNLITKIKNNNEEKIGSFSDYQNLPRMKNQVEKYIKLPTESDKILHEQSAAYYSIFAIKSLEKYCNSNNIFFRWLSWCDQKEVNIIKSENKIQFLNENLKIVFKNKKWVFEDLYGNNIDCHTEFKNENTFYSALDDDGYGVPHLGKHVHIHMAEAFEKEIRTFK